MALIHAKPIKDFTLNEINRKNTYQDTEIVDFIEGNTKFAVGFWPALDNDDNEHPMLMLITWTPTGWITLAKLPPLWNDDLMMNMGSDSDDLNNYMWYIGETFTSPLQNYLATIGENTVPLENWKKVLTLLSSVRFEGGRLEFNRKL